MSQLEIDIEKITLLGVKKEAENYRFRSFLKGQDSDKVDRIVHRLDKEIRAQIDCQKCGNCCNYLSPNLKDSEIEILSRVKGLTISEFMSLHVEEDSEMNEFFLKDLPCIFLNDKSCSIYNDIPKDCTSYPHTQKNDFTSRTLGIIYNYGICPIVFNLFEKLKLEMGFK